MSAQGLISLAKAASVGWAKLSKSEKAVSLFLVSFVSSQPPPCQRCLHSSSLLVFRQTFRSGTTSMPVANRELPKQPYVESAKEDMQAWKVKHSKA